MILAQLSTNQIPYDAIDWLQIAVYFLALPVVALLGASLGLLGRIRRGGVLWSTNVGLLGGAVACVILALGLTTLGIHDNRWFYSYFSVQYRWMMLGMTLFATAACALAAGVAWRVLHAPREKQPVNISIANVMLVQLFAFISLGSFIGLRQFMLPKAALEPNPLVFSLPGWKLEPNGIEARFDATGLTPKECAQALSRERVIQIARFPEIRRITLDYDPAWSADLTPLLSSTQVSALSIKLEQPSQQLIEELAESKNQHLTLEGDLRTLDLSPLSKSTSIKTLRLKGQARLATLESLKDSEHLSELALEELRVVGKDRAIEHWPECLKSLIAGQVNLDASDLRTLADHPNLKQVLTSNVEFDNPTISVFQSIPNLEWATFSLQTDSKVDMETLANWKIARLGIHLHGKPVTAPDLRKLKSLANLRALEVSTSAIDDEAIATLTELNSLEVLTLSTGAVSDAGLWKLATHPKLRLLRIPQSTITNRVESNFTDARTGMNLPSVLLQPFVPIAESTQP